MSRMIRARPTPNTAGIGATIGLFLLMGFAGVWWFGSRAASNPAADLNADLQVNVFDLSVLLSNWGLTGSRPADINHDNTVNVFDLSVLLANWGPVSAATPTPTPTPTPSGTGAVCPAYPAFPDAACTGWQHTGVTLKTVPGQIANGNGWEWRGAPFNYVAVTDNNAVLDGLDINGCVYVDNTVVTTATIKRSRITGNCDYLIRLEDFDRTTALNITDTELVGGAVQQKGTGFNWLRVNAHDFTGKAAMTGTSATVEDSYLHDNVCHPPDHQSATGTNGGSSNVIIRHNSVDLTPTECTSGGIANYDDFGAFHNVQIDKNLINSGGYCLKAGFEDNNAAGNTAMQVTGNVFGRKYFADCGSFGVVSNWMPAVSGTVWSGNTWGGGAAATGAHQVGDTVNP